MQGSSASSVTATARKPDGRPSISSYGTRAPRRSWTHPFAPHSRNIHNSPSTLSVSPSISPILGPTEPAPLARSGNAGKRNEEECEGKQRELTITLWGRSELSAHLARDDPAYSGRVLYWFGVEALTPAWFREQFEKARVSLGTRYMPETNVELAIRQEFLAFARYPQLQVEIDDWFNRVSEKGGSAVAAIRATQAPEARTQAEAVAGAVDSLATLLNADPVPSGSCYPTQAWKSTTTACLDVAREVLRWCFSLPPSKPQSSIDKPELWARHGVHELIVALQGIRDELSSTRWRMANANAVLLKGPAGIGKSHLLADFVNHQLENGGPAVLLLGGGFVDGEPWPQIRERLDRPATESFRHFLGALDAAAQAAEARALVCIDALNERHGLDVWPERLPAFLEEFRAFPRVCAVLSCRSTFVPHVIPEALGSDKLVRVEHEGFAGDGEDAASIYLDMRGIVRPGAPNMVPSSTTRSFSRPAATRWTQPERPSFQRVCEASRPFSTSTTTRWPSRCATE